MASNTVNAVTKAAKRIAKEGSVLPNRAYVTFLAGDGDYWKGVVGLVKGLRKAKSAYPLVVAVLPDVPKEHRNKLIRQGSTVREIEPVCPPGGQNKFAWAYYAINYSKLRMWEFVEHSKMVYLDADVQVFNNIDNLFDLPNGYFYAAVDCLCVTWPEQCPDKVKWPQELGPEPKYYFNAGVFVFEPSSSTYVDLLKILEVTPPTAYAEQDLLNMFFKDIYKPIPPNYNFLVAMLWRHREEIELDKVKVVHYCASGSKPWRYTGKEENMDREDVKLLVKKWWDIYDDETLDLERKIADYNEIDALGFHPSLSEAAVILYIAGPHAA